ncbi:MAG: NERD domain-containing protein [Gammaproteobacteria bacterium]|nr:NERD domain-containing protein [Gammaproteobacteria bacterium]
MNTATVVVVSVAGVAVAALAAFGAVAGWRRFGRYRRRRQIARTVAAAGSAMLQDVVIPDGSGGQLHLDFLLLTSGGLLVVDLRDVNGIVFGGEHLREWTVMDGNERSTFLNPLEAMYDRLAAVRLLAADLPVEGRIVFTERSRFPKGKPPLVTPIDSLAAEFPSPAEAVSERLREAWETISGATEPSPLARR